MSEPDQIKEEADQNVVVPDQKMVEADQNKAVPDQLKGKLIKIWRYLIK